MALPDDVRAEWLSVLTRAAPADRPAAEGALRALYAADGRELRHVVWLDSPTAAAWAVALLTAPHHFLWADLVAQAGRTRRLKPTLEATRAALIGAAGADSWEGAVAAFGAPIGRGQHLPGMPARPIGLSLFQARVQRHGGQIDAPGRLLDAAEPLALADKFWWGVSSAAGHQAGHHTTSGLVAGSFFDEYPFWAMAADAAVGVGDPPALLAAAWAVARASGPWWPFAGGAVCAERPIEAHTTPGGLLHRGDGPAAVYPDGSTVFAWEGRSVPPTWILDPARISPRDLAHAPASFRAHVRARLGKRPERSPG